MALTRIESMNVGESGVPEIVSGNEVRKIYDDLYMRAEILEYMIAADILEYDPVLEALLWTQGAGIEKAHAHFKKEAMMKKGLEIETEIAIKLGKKVD